MLDVAICVVTIGVQVAKDHILAQNLHKNMLLPSSQVPFSGGVQARGLEFSGSVSGQSCFRIQAL